VSSTFTLTREIHSISVNSSLWRYAEFLNFETRTVLDRIKGQNFANIGFYEIMDKPPNRQLFYVVKVFYFLGNVLYIDAKR